jgi:hypothetical protein
MPASLTGSGEKKMGETVYPGRKFHQELKVHKSTRKIKPKIG